MVQRSRTPHHHLYFFQALEWTVFLLSNRHLYRSPRLSSFCLRTNLRGPSERPCCHSLHRRRMVRHGDGTGARSLESIALGMSQSVEAQSSSIHDLLQWSRFAYTTDCFFAFCKDYISMFPCHPTTNVVLRQSRTINSIRTLSPSTSLKRSPSASLLLKN